MTDIKLCQFSKVVFDNGFKNKVDQYIELTVATVLLLPLSAISPSLPVITVSKDGALLPTHRNPIRFNLDNIYPLSSIMMIII